MKIVALIDHDRQPDVVENILKHCKLWKEPMQRGPPPVAVGDSLPPGLIYDPGYASASSAQRFEKDSTKDTMEMVRSTCTPI